MSRSGPIRSGALSATVEDEASWTCTLPPPVVRVGLV